MERNLIEIRPLTITEIITAAFRSLYRNPAATLLISLNFSLILGLISLFGYYLLPVNSELFNNLASLGETEALESADLESLLPQVLPILTFFGVSTFFLYLFQGVVTGLLSPAVGFLVTGKKLTKNETWMRSKSKINKLFALSLLIIIIEITAFLTPLFITATISAIFPQAIGSLLVTLGLIVSLGMLIFVWTRYLLAPVILILENTSIKFSLTRSSNLVKKNFARIFFGTIWASLVGQALAFFASIPFSLISQASQDSGEITTFSVFTETIGSIFSYIFLLSFFASYLCLLYTDQRIRHENLAENLKSALG